MAKLTVKQREYSVEATPDTPLLWVLRDSLGLTGTKYGCGMALCGACTVHLDGAPVRFCLTPLSAAQGKAVVTIEGHPLQRAWVQEEVAQCGYCQPGQIMAAAALLSRHPARPDADIDTAMTGNSSRCGTYERIRRAVQTAAKLAGGAR